MTSAGLKASKTVLTAQRISKKVTPVNPPTASRSSHLQSLNESNLCQQGATEGLNEYFDPKLCSPSSFASAVTTPGKKTIISTHSNSGASSASSSPESKSIN